MASTMNSYDLFTKNLNTNSDISGHLKFLSDLGQMVDRITEFGVRGGMSTSAWLHAKPNKLVCYDIAIPAGLELFQTIACENGTEFEFHQANTAEVSIEPCDLLFLDTLHNDVHLSAELKNFVHVRKYLVFHDTEANGWVGEDNGGGLKKTLIDFLLANPAWRVATHFTHNNGLTVLTN